MSNMKDFPNETNEVALGDGLDEPGQILVDETRHIRTDVTISSPRSGPVGNSFRVEGIAAVIMRHRTVEKFGAQLIEDIHEFNILNGVAVKVGCETKRATLSRSNLENSSEWYCDFSNVPPGPVSIIATVSQIVDVGDNAPPPHHQQIHVTDEVSRTIVVDNNETIVFKADFNSDTVGSPPAFDQEIGTVVPINGDGMITVELLPSINNGPITKWIQIQHPTLPGGPSNPTALECEISEFRTNGGNYTIWTELYIPTGTEVVSMQFETHSLSSTPKLGFLHLDFMPEGYLRIDDGPVTFGSFPKDATFLLSVNLDIQPSSNDATITLFCGNASGTKNVTIDPRLHFAAEQFGTLRFWMSFDQEGSFFMDNIIVTRR